MKIREYPETHQRGSVVQDSEFPKNNRTNVDFGIQIAEDGRVWICINGKSFIRFAPKKSK